MKRDNTLLAGIILIVLGLVGLISLDSLGPQAPIRDTQYASWMMGPSMMGSGMMGALFTKTTFSSNGERIYYTATSDSGEPITFTMGMMEMATPMMSCVNCHGKDGRGGTVRMMGMMGSFEAPDIRYKTLTSKEDAEQEGHPPYTDELLKRAITEGLNPAGEPLRSPMPQWKMSEEDLLDLIEYLKTLE